MKNKPQKDGFLHLQAFPGGKKALNKFIIAHLKYPKDALRNNIEGKVFITFEVNNEGEVQNVKVIKGIGFGCNEEAKRVVSLLKYTPAQNKKNNVVLRKKLHIEFKLSEKKKNKQTIQYTLTPKNKGDKQPKTIHYTIKISD